MLTNVSRETLLKTIVMGNISCIGKKKTEYIKEHQSTKKYLKIFKSSNSHIRI